MLFRRLVGPTADETDIAALCHQVMVLQQQLGRRPKLTRWDRLLFAALYHVQPQVVHSISIVPPETVVRWHRAGFRLLWKRKSRGKAGRPHVPLEVRRLIRQISLENPLWGAPRSHGELLKLGISVCQTTVARYMVRGRRPPSQGWLTFLRNHANGIAAIDLFVVPTISFRFLYGLVILHLGRRRIVHVGATYHPTAEWLARQITEAFPWDAAPDHLIRDRDRACGDAFRRSVSATGIRDGPTAPRSPWQNGHVERTIGSIRRELLDHVIVTGERHLRCLLRDYADYHNTWRTHLGLDKDTPLTRPVRRNGAITSMPKPGGLHRAYVRIRFLVGTGCLIQPRRLKVRSSLMCLFFSLIPATVWLVVGYFVLFSSAKSSGGMQTFGRALAIWTFVIAVFFPIAGAYVSLAGLCPMEDVLRAMHGAQT